MATTSGTLTGHNDIQVGGVPVTYDSVSGQVSINGETLDGRLLIELAARVAKARQRDGHDAKLGLGGGSSDFVGLHLDEQQIEAKQLELMWENLPIYYPEAKREAIQGRVEGARALIEG